MLTKSKAIVLRTVRYGDGGLVVDMLTPAMGRVTFFCHLAKGRRGNMRRQMFQPLSILNVEFDMRLRLQMQRLKSMEVAVPFVTIPFDVSKSAIAIFVAEFLSYATRGGQDDTALFDYVADSLLWLDGARQGYANFHIVFMLRVSRFLGFYPNMEGYSEDSWFDLREGVFSPLRPRHDDFVAPGEAKSVVELMRLSYSTMHVYAMNRADRNRCTEQILSYYRLHVPGFPEMKSLPVLKELFT